LPPHKIELTFPCRDNNRSGAYVFYDVFYIQCKLDRLVPKSAFKRGKRREEFIFGAAAYARLTPQSREGYGAKADEERIPFLGSIGRRGQDIGRERSFSVYSFRRADPAFL